MFVILNAGSLVVLPCRLNPSVLRKVMTAMLVRSNNIVRSGIKAQYKIIAVQLSWFHLKSQLRS